MLTKLLMRFDPEQYRVHQSAAGLAAPFSSTSNPGKSGLFWVLHEHFGGSLRVVSRLAALWQRPFLLKWQRPQTLYYIFIPTVTTVPTVRVFSPFMIFSKMAPILTGSIMPGA
jgi:hypothetical protein